MAADDKRSAIDEVKLTDSYISDGRKILSDPGNATLIKDKKKRMLQLYNQMSVLDFSEAGKVGPKADLLEKRPKEEQDKAASKLEDPSADYHIYWKERPTNILFIKKINDTEVAEKFLEISEWLIKELNMILIVEPVVFEDMNKGSFGDKLYENHKDHFLSWRLGNEYSQKEALSAVDLIICIGGDGTLLYAVSLFEETIPPVISFAMGSLGFLTLFNVEKYKDAITRVLEKHVSVTQRLRLQCKVISDQEYATKMADECYLTPEINELKFDFTPKKKQLNRGISYIKESEFTSLEDKHLHKELLVMNEVVVDRGPSPYLTNIQIFCNGRLMTTVQGDGIIVATPTGSTAYALAAGASMVHPSVSSMIICPICPHSLSFRPVVVPAGVEIMIRVAPQARNAAWVGFDGRNRFELSKGDSVVIRASTNPVPCVNNTGHVTDWFDSLARCLNWNVREVQKEMK